MRHELDGNPTIEEIRLMCSAIQKDWSRREERARRSGRWGDKVDSNAVIRWRVPQVRMPQIDR